MCVLCIQTVSLEKLVYRMCFRLFLTEANNCSIFNDLLIAQRNTVRSFAKHNSTWNLPLSEIVFYLFIRCYYIGTGVLGGLKFLSAPAMHPQNLTCPAPTRVWGILPPPAPHTSNPHQLRRPSKRVTAPHFFRLIPTPVRKLLITHNKGKFCCNKIVRNMNFIFSKVVLKVAFMHNHLKPQWFSQARYRNVMLNISKYYLGSNYDLLPAISAACWSFGNLSISRTVLDWCLAGSFLQLLLGYHSIRIGYQREQN